MERDAVKLLSVALRLVNMCPMSERPRILRRFLGSVQKGLDELSNLPSSSSALVPVVHIDDSTVPSGSLCASGECLCRATSSGYTTSSGEGNDDFMDDLGDIDLSLFEDLAGFGKFCAFLLMSLCLMLLCVDLSIGILLRSHRGCSVHHELI